MLLAKRAALKAMEDKVARQDNMGKRVARARAEVGTYTVLATSDVAMSLTKRGFTSRVVYMWRMTWRAMFIRPWAEDRAENTKRRQQTETTEVRLCH